jgi:hypothetical protein
MKFLLKNGDEYAIPDAEYEVYLEAYGEELVRAECQAMQMWLFANAAKRKTKGGMKKFIGGWLARTKATGGLSPFAANHNPDSKSTKNHGDSIRGRTLDCSLTDVTWLDGIEREAQKQYYLTTRGFYFDGGDEPTRG